MFQLVTFNELGASVCAVTKTTREELIKRIETTANVGQCKAAAYLDDYVVRGKGHFRLGWDAVIFTPDPLPPIPNPIYIHIRVVGTDRSAVKLTMTQALAVYRDWGYSGDFGNFKYGDVVRKYQDEVNANHEELLVIKGN